MSHAASSPPFPRAPLIAAALIIAGTITLATVSRLAGTPDNTPVSTPVAAREVLFVDRADGAVAVYDAGNRAQPIEVLAPTTNGFLRAAMRGLAHQRKRAGDGADTPFRLTAWADGRITLEDLATGRKLEMAAFGGTNEAVFAELLTARTMTSQASR